MDLKEPDLKEPDVKAHPKNFCGALGLYGLEGTGLKEPD